jgi:hypothetical protein
MLDSGTEEGATKVLEVGEKVDVRQELKFHDGIVRMLMKLLKRKGRCQAGTKIPRLICSGLLGNSGRGIIRFSGEYITRYRGMRGIGNGLTIYHGSS